MRKNKARSVALGVKRRQLSVSYLPIDELELNPKNPRIHTPEQIRQLAESIERFGFNSPILAVRKRVVAGHGRILAAKRSGLTRVPVIQIDLTDAEAKAYGLADNRLAEIATWDDHLLAELLSELSKYELDFNLEVTGFTAGEIDVRIESLSDAAEDDDVGEHDITSGPIVSKVGDLWHLGDHRVMCANALDPESYRVLMNGKKAAMAITDPPYNVRIRGHASGLGHVQHREFPMASGEMDRHEYTKFLADICNHIARNSLPGAILFTCIDWRHLREMLAAVDGNNCELLNICVWVKDRAGMGSLFRSQHEFVLVLKIGKARHRNNIQLGRFGRNRTNVWHYPSANSFGRGSEEGNLLTLHPTPKPVAMIADAIKDCSARNGMVLDPFLGSGTAVIAAERTGRRCYGLELDPRYVDTTIRRWQARTGQLARHEMTGHTFNELQTEKSHDPD